MYKLYWSEGTACFAPQAVLEEAGLAYDIIKIDTTRSEHRTPDYLAINPAGKVPALILPNGEIMYEAAAICLYLAETRGREELAPAVSDPSRALFLRSLFYLTNTVQDTYKQFFYPERYSTHAADAVHIKAKACENLLERWRPVELHLSAQGPYHLGERISLADIYLVMLATWFIPAEDLFV